jgi:CRISPR type III-B/RAMP module-associated protein Cmr5
MTANTKRPTLNQQRAAHAWKAAEHADKQFGEQAKKLGPRILTAGLGPAVQFMIAKEEALELVKTLEGWLLEEGPTKLAPRPASLMYDIVNGGSDRLRWVTAESLAYLAWLNRFCEARGLTGDET